MVLWTRQLKTKRKTRQRLVGGFTQPNGSPGLPHEQKPSFSLYIQLLIDFTVSHIHKKQKQLETIERYLGVILGANWCGFKHLLVLWSWRFEVSLKTWKLLICWKLKVVDLNIGVEQSSRYNLWFEDLWSTRVWYALLCAFLLNFS